MRLDKFLKVSRLVKRRTLAKELCDQGRVCVNQYKAKAGTVVTTGDVLRLSFGNKELTVKIENIVGSASKEGASELFSVMEEKGRMQ